MPNLDRCYSVGQASDKTGIPRRTLQDAITRGALKATKFGDGQTSAYVIDIDDLNDYLNERSA